jgi:hypothetical protein
MFSMVGESSIKRGYQRLEVGRGRRAMFAVFTVAKFGAIEPLARSVNTLG